MIDHDRLFKELLSTFFVEFLDLFLPQVASQIDRDSIQFLPQEVFTDVTSGEKKEIDLLAQVRYQGQETCFLIHVENQSYTKKEFAKRMFKYFARLHEKYDLPIYPVVIFSFDEPKRPEPQNYRVRFGDFNVLEFQFAAIQLNRLSWRDFLTQPNPVAAALMAKMNIPKQERPQVKAECLRLLATLRLDPARMQLISGFVDTYLRLDAAEEQAFQAAIDTMGLTQQEEIMEIVTSWEEKAAQKTKREIAANLLREGIATETIVRVTGLTPEQVQELLSQLTQEN
ncbi:Rpn family recombination-promoting nuclease/putative transposase [Nostoc sp. FACHB-87]|uniref:Rpn family recombination-promoting nuclease/putative transposase n=1 Tax=Nostocales TaxID=1161 RepID=UPI001683BD22|nr:MULTISPECIES: Rpn family recombination-promoting nuclease/putative transposase [Nostocales]MBD2458520.1 Rpn family recombination-promoting nuclease/putative transposase [Nostoc sp. FACHB-87]MBD2479600.1 Rpn family recombination-promoting nuclease/putative transposase [Anabaena sp. FACHB-83]MBD2492234.1 Rpn family recombination-promoting nuclease/putative transposase [Aulosira sp. FACHB-615]